MMEDFREKHDEKSFIFDSKMKNYSDSITAEFDRMRAEMMEKMRKMENELRKEVTKPKSFDASTQTSEPGQDRSSTTGAHSSNAKKEISTQTPAESDRDQNLLFHIDCKLNAMKKLFCSKMDKWQATYENTLNQQAEAATHKRIYTYTPMQEMLQNKRTMGLDTSMASPHTYITTGGKILPTHPSSLVYKVSKGFRTRESLDPNEQHIRYETECRSIGRKNRGVSNICSYSPEKNVSLPTKLPDSDTEISSDFYNNKSRVRQGNSLDEFSVPVKNSCDAYEFFQDGGNAAESTSRSSSEADPNEQTADKIVVNKPIFENPSEKAIQCNRESLTRNLVESMFERHILASSNVTGARGKFMLDPMKIAKLREIVFTQFPAQSQDEEEDIWRVLTTKINTKCRGVKRLLKRKIMYGEALFDDEKGASSKRMQVN